MEKSLKIPKRHRASLTTRKARNGYFFVSPFLIGIVLIYLPILFDSVWFSFCATDGSWEGLKYYKEALFGNNSVLATIFASLQRIILEVPAVVIFSLFIAVVLNQKMLGRAVFRAIFFVPVLISTGFMESLLNNVGQGSETLDKGNGQSSGSEIISMLDVQALLGNMKVGTELVTYVVGIVNSVYNYINYSGVQMLIFLAGLQSISPSIYEASKIEGATGWETFWKITFPMISPMILVNAIYSAINAFTRNGDLFDTTSSFGAASTWLYIIVVIVVIAVVVLLLSTFIFYQRRD